MIDIAIISPPYELEERKGSVFPVGHKITLTSSDLVRLVIQLIIYIYVYIFYILNILPLYRMRVNT